MLRRFSIPSGRRFSAAVFLAAVLAAAFLLPGSRARASEGEVVIDPALLSQLVANPTGGVEAVITTWNQSGLDAVQQLGIEGTRLNALPLLLTHTLTLAQLEALADLAAVRSVYPNRSYDLYMEDTTWIVRARQVWQPVEEGGEGITGDGVHIAVIDTGAAGLHEDMDNLVEFCETQQAATSDHPTVLCSPFDPASGNVGPAGPSNDPRTDGTDDNGHGSHVSGTIAGSGDASGGREATHSTIGIAPDASLHVYSANVGAALADHEILASYDDLIHKKALGLTEVVAVSNSWGGGDGSNYNPDDPTNVAVKAAYDVGILSVFAAGNSGPEHDTLSSQCVNPYVVCVAASTKNDSVVMFSSRGRPSEAADTNRDGVVGGVGDVAPDNHDRALGQALELGVYRPTLSAPGANINSIRHDAATCYEGPIEFDMDCYAVFNGTSMATPHVSGAVALITEAYRQGHGGETPTPAIITDILERSAAVSKLPGYDAEEQGAGRLNALAAVRFAKSYPDGLPPVNWGTATPPYATGNHPGAPASITQSAGCTSALSWSTASGYGQHVISVPEEVERLRITANWGAHPSANLYMQLWRPGVDPDAGSNPAGPNRVFPDQEATGLVFVGTSRWVDVRTPEAGNWTLRVYHRAGGAAELCDPTSDENPKQTLGFNYDLTIEMPLAADTPVAAITSPSAGDTLSGRFIDIEGSASYPTQWDGIAAWNVPGSGNPATVPGEEDNRPALYFQGNLEEGCSGDGSADVLLCDGPMLVANEALSAAPAASWKVADPLFDSTNPRNNVDPNWIWHLEQPTTLAGPMTVEFWAACGLCSSAIGISADWEVALYADGQLVAMQRLTAPPLFPNLPQKLSLTVNVSQVTASESFVLQIDPVYIDSQVNTYIYYDSALPCPGALSGACDSLVRMPVPDPNSPVPVIPSNVRVIDRHDSLLLAWDEAFNATTYDIYRSTDPSFDIMAATLIATTAGTACNAPDVPTWPGASRSGLCFTDSSFTPGDTYYYRVVGRNGGLTGKASLLAYGAATTDDRQVKVGFNRLWGPRIWEYATLLNAGATLWQAVWDTLEVDPDASLIAARAFTQGVGSANAIVQPDLSLGAVKVKGGGKVAGETPPAEGVKEATFGFTIRGGNAPSGDLKLHDHETVVRIRALSIESLAVSGNSCTITGLAEVTRDGATTVESFTATCQDNSASGDGDLFEIVTDSYTGGGELTGGNIKIESE